MAFIDTSVRHTIAVPSWSLLAHQHPSVGFTNARVATSSSARNLNQALREVDERFINTGRHRASQGTTSASSLTLHLPKWFRILSANSRNSCRRRFR
jgi:hypothetical protein